jgi:plastocyanin/TolB-like protein
LRWIALLILLTISVSIAGTPVVAMLDLEAINCDKAIARAISETVRTEVVTSYSFTVAERAQIDRVMEELAFQQSGIVDANSAVELGRIVGANYVCIGSVNQIAGSYSIAVRFISVETGIAVGAAMEQANNVENIWDACDTLVRKIVEIELPASNIYVSKNETGMNLADTTSGESIERGVNAVWVDEFFFHPEEITIGVGTKLWFVNQGLYSHTATFDFFSSPLLSPVDSPGNTWSHVFNEAGDFFYYSAVDPPVMTGVVHVK